MRKTYPVWIKKPLLVEGENPTSRYTLQKLNDINIVVIAKKIPNECFD